MKYRARVDSNQPIIVEILRKRGFQVVHTYWLGKGYPDIHIAKNGEDWMIEIKDGNEKLTEAEEVFHRNWQGKPIVIMRSEEDALNFGG